VKLNGLNLWQADFKVCLNRKIIYLYDMINKLASYKPFLIQISVQSLRRDALRNIRTVKDLYLYNVHLCWLSPSTDELVRLPESFLDQRKSIYFCIKMEMNSFTFVYFN